MISLPSLKSWPVCDTHPRVFCFWWLVVLPRILKAAEQQWGPEAGDIGRKQQQQLNKQQNTDNSIFLCSLWLYLWWNFQPDHRQWMELTQRSESAGQPEILTELFPFWSHCSGKGVELEEFLWCLLPWKQRACWWRGGKEMCDFRTHKRKKSGGNWEAAGFHHSFPLRVSSVRFKTCSAGRISVCLRRLSLRNYSFIAGRCARRFPLPQVRLGTERVRFSLAPDLKCLCELSVFCWNRGDGGRGVHMGIILIKLRSFLIPGIVIRCWCVFW